MTTTPPQTDLHESSLRGARVAAWILMPDDDATTRPETAAAATIAG